MRQVAPVAIFQLVQQLHKRPMPSASWAKWAESTGMKPDISLDRRPSLAFEGMVQSQLQDQQVPGIN